MNTTTGSNHNRQTEKKLAVGHELPLASMIRNKRHIEISMGNGTMFYGIVQGFDKFTITLSSHYMTHGNNGLDVSLLESESPVTIFKHAIDSFRSVEV